MRSVGRALHYWVLKPDRCWLSVLPLAANNNPFEPPCEKKLDARRLSVNSNKLRERKRERNTCQIIWAHFVRGSNVTQLSELLLHSSWKEERAAIPYFWPNILIWGADFVHTPFLFLWINLKQQSWPRLFSIKYSIQKFWTKCWRNRQGWGGQSAQETVFVGGKEAFARRRWRQLPLWFISPLHPFVRPSTRSMLQWLFLSRFPFTFCSLSLASNTSSQPKTRLHLI